MRGYRPRLRLWALRSAPEGPRTRDARARVALFPVSAGTARESRLPALSRLCLSVWPLSAALWGETQTGPPTTFAANKQNRLSLLSTDPLPCSHPDLSVYGKHITVAVSLSTLSNYDHHHSTRHPWAQKDAVRRQEPSFHCPSPDGGPASSPIPTQCTAARAVHTCRRAPSSQPPYVSETESAPAGAADAQSGS